MKKQFSVFLLSIGIAAMSLGVTGCSSQEVNAKEITEEVEVTEEANQIDVFGKVEATIIREIAVDFPAAIETIDLKVGDLANQGTQVMGLNYESYKKDLLKKEQEIQLLKIERDGAYGSLNPQSAEISQMGKELKTKEARLADGTDAEYIKLENQITLLTKQIKEKEKECEVNKSLAEAGALSEKQLKEQDMALLELKNQKVQAESSLKQLKTNRQLEVDTLRGSIAAKQALASNTSIEKTSNVESLDVKIQTAEAELKEMQGRLNKSYLKGDAIIIDEAEGVIYEIPVTEGTRLEGGEPILRLINPNELVINVDVPEAFINKMKVGNQADITFTASADEIIKGKVSRIAQTARVVNGENMINVELEVTDQTAALKQGYEVSAIIYY